MTHPKPTAGTVKPTTPKPASKAEKAPASAKEPASAAAPVAKARLAFPLMLTVVAVLPLAMGVGAVRLKASASATKPISADLQKKQEVEEPNQVSAADRRTGDEHFIKRQYDLALRHYQSLGSSEVNRLPADLLYRNALCEEGLGRWNEAVEHLQIVAQIQDQPVLKAAALFGQARIWMHRNEPAKAAALLRHLVFQSEFESAIPTRMAREIAFLIPLALSKSATAEVQFADRVDSTYRSPSLKESLENAFEWADQSLQNDPFLADADAPSNACRIQWKTSASQTVGAMPIESQIIEVCCRQQTLRSIVQRIADEAGWRVDWSDLQQDRSLDQLVSMTTDGQPLSLVLTVICSEFQSIWTLRDDCLIVSRSGLNGEDRRGMIARSLLSLTKWIPNNRSVDEARFALAEIAQSECCIAEAADLFAAVAGSNSSPLAVRAAANSADNYYRIRDYASACTQLKNVVDGAPGSQLQAQSLVTLGRLQLDLGETQNAIFQLRRATDINNTHEIQARASVLLGLGYLLQNKYAEAAEAVFVRKFQFEEPEVRNAAAFVTSFARWKFTHGDSRERESTYLYRSLLAINPDLEWIGQSGRLLIGRAYQELGFGENMAELFAKMLSGDVTENIREEITFSMASHEMENDRPESAKRMWWKLSNGHSTRLASRSRLRLAAIALIEERPKDCLEICELIQVDEEVSIRDIQKLMGRAFEQLGEYGLAAKCYAGEYKLPR